MAVLVALLLVAGAGCSVVTTVSVEVAPSGAGRVSVTVTLDRQALAEVGGLGQLRTSDLTAAGWQVSKPGVATGATATVTAAHAFDDQAQLDALLRSVVAPTTVGGRRIVPVEVHLEHHRSFFATTTAVSGHVDLACGIGCFGDAGLSRHFGSRVGVEAGPLTGRRGSVAATRDLRFSLSLTLPGSLRSSDATTRVSARGTSHLTWTTPLGAVIPLAATTSSSDHAHLTDVVVAAVAAAVVVAVAVGLLVGLLVRRRRRSRLA